VRVLAVGQGRWNTIDGNPPSQASVDGLQHPTQATDGNWPVQPTIVTPYTLQVTKPVRGSVPAPSVVGYHDGGQAGRDSIGGCETTADRLENGPPTVGRTYLVLFSRELSVDGLGARPVQQPMIADMYPYDPSGDVVTTAEGTTTLAEALRGLPPG
jgi:hypothetical protein